MKSFALIAAMLSSAAFSPIAAQEQTLQFDMHVSPGASKCLPKAFDGNRPHLWKL